jgi:protein SCO1/2
MNGIKPIRAVAWALLLAVLFEAGQAMTAADGVQSAPLGLADAALLDREGRPVKFASEAIKDRIVAINFVYTGCTTVCPLSSAIFKTVQDKLGSRLGKEVWLVSVSLDPVHDTPERIRAYASRYKAGPGWLWLTGSKPEVERVLGGLGASSANFTGHPPLVLVGDSARNHWTRIYALPGPGLILSKLEELLAARSRVAEHSKIAP